MGGISRDESGAGQPSRPGLPVRWAQETLGQSTVEYALLLAGFLAVCLALAAVWHAARDGDLGRLARQAASHAIDGGIRDIVAF